MGGVGGFAGTLAGGVWFAGQPQVPCCIGSGGGYDTGATGGGGGYGGGAGGIVQQSGAGGGGGGGGSFAAQSTITISPQDVGTQSGNGYLWFAFNDPNFPDF